MANELTVLDSNEIIEVGVSTFNENELPTVIQGQVTMLNDLDKSVRKALEAAETAKSSARTARGKSAGLFHKKVAIEELQSAGVDLAEAVVSEAEAQKISFEFQTKLAEITKYIFGLGVSNIASNRSVVRELELKLKGASEEELTELARQEITNVIRQLKAQEDILVKQANLFKIAEDHDKELKAQSQRQEDILVKQASLLKISEDHDKELKAQSQRYEQHDEQLKIHLETEKLHEEQLKTHEKIGKEHDEKLRLHAEKDRQHDEELHVRAKKDEEHDSYLENLQKTYHEMEKYIEEQSQVIEVMKIKLGQLNDKVENIHPLLTNKAGRFFPIVSFILSFVALIGTVVFIFIK
ncbi:MAG: hypothetical protein LBR10_03425 [Prevotellaceae bacterium]|jgi:hypothetical protein|nr:hypothetical protein [Prevotellaceae bacterium]